MAKRYAYNTSATQVKKRYAMIGSTATQVKKRYAMIGSTATLVYTAEENINPNLSFTSINTGQTPKTASYTVNNSAGFESMDLTVYSSENWDYRDTPDWFYHPAVYVDGTEYKLSAGTQTITVSIKGKTSVVVKLSLAVWGGGIYASANVSNIRLY